MTDIHDTPVVPTDGPDLIRILDASGAIAPTPAAQQFIADLEAVTDDELEAFYREMVISRAIDVQATNLQRQGQLALWPPSFGQEAAQVGSAFAARAQDTIFPSYREHIVAKIRGVDPVDIIKLMRGVSHGGWDPADPKNGNTRLYTLVLGSQTLHAAGFGMGLAFDGRTNTGDVEKDEAVVVYYGDGASSQGDVHEAMVFAASYNAPQVFFLQNNQWAISVPVSRQSRTPLYQRAAGYMPSYQIDGNDVLAAYLVTRRLLDEAREGQGPRAIEAVTYRRGAHTTSDDPTKYRSREEETAWAERDPITRMRTFLRSRGASDAFFDAVDAEGAAAAEDLRVRSTQLQAPGVDSMFLNVYTDAHPLMDEQRRWIADYEASFEGGQA